MIRSTIHPRRALVLAGVALSLVLGAATIRAAATWASASAPLTDAPPTVAALNDALALEQARSAALREQLDQLVVGSADLSTALAAARDRIAADAGHADELRSALATAKDRLAALEKSIRAASKVTTVRAVGAAAAPSGSGGHAYEEQDDGDD